METKKVPVPPSVQKMLDAAKLKKSDAKRKEWPVIRFKVRDGNGIEAIVNMDRIREEASLQMGVHQEEMNLIAPGAMILIAVMVEGHVVWQNPLEAEFEG